MEHEKLFKLLTAENVGLRALCLERKLRMQHLVSRGNFLLAQNNMISRSL